MLINIDKSEEAIFGVSRRCWPILRRRLANCATSSRTRSGSRISSASPSTLLSSTRLAMHPNLEHEDSHGGTRRPMQSRLSYWNQLGIGWWRRMGSEAAPPPPHTHKPFYAGGITINYVKTTLHWCSSPSIKYCGVLRLVRLLHLSLHLENFTSEIR